VGDLHALGCGGLRVQLLLKPSRDRLRDLLLLSELRGRSLGDLVFAREVLDGSLVILEQLGDLLRMERGRVSIRE
jgi:hypothetical protein